MALLWIFVVLGGQLLLLNNVNTISDIENGKFVTPFNDTNDEYPDNLPRQFYISSQKGDNIAAKGCTTSDGTLGQCKDLGECPQLLLNLDILRQSFCFKSLFIPGVCCPATTSLQTTTKRTILRPVAASYTSTTTTTTTTTTTKKPRTTTQRAKVTTSTTQRPPIFTYSPPVVDAYECGLPEVESSRVVGGVKSKPGHWPWMAAIYLHGPRGVEFWCGGSLITPKHILTAAHCTRDGKQRTFSPRQMTIRLGDVDLKRDDEPSLPADYKVARIRAHSDFNPVGYYNDIAVMAMDQSARMSKYVMPLCLPDNSIENFMGRSATVVGWGTTSYGGKESAVQYQAQLPIWSNENCNLKYFQPITSNFVCAGYLRGGIDACQGDSGGPLMLPWNNRWMQIGIVSFGNKCGEPGYPGVYTRISEYLHWIRNNTIN